MFRRFEIDRLLLPLAVAVFSIFYLAGIIFRCKPLIYFRFCFLLLIFYLIFAAPIVYRKVLIYKLKKECQLKSD